MLPSREHKKIETLTELTELVVTEPKLAYDHIIRQPGFLKGIFKKQAANQLLFQLSDKPETLENYMECVSQVFMPGDNIHEQILEFLARNPCMAHKIQESLTSDYFIRLTNTNINLACTILNSPKYRRLLASNIKSETDRRQFIDCLTQTFPNIFNPMPITKIDEKNSIEFKQTLARNSFDYPKKHHASRSKTSTHRRKRGKTFIGCSI
jgi:hypothetical protein